MASPGGTARCCRTIGYHTGQRLALSSAADGSAFGGTRASRRAAGELTFPPLPSRLGGDGTEDGGQTMAEREVLLKVEAVALDWKGNPIVVLREQEGHRAVFIWVGLSEASAISMQMEGQQVARPMTHDLIVTMLHELQVGIERVTITDMHQNTYFASLLLRDGESTITIDCRPSDAIAIALRTNSPIHISDDLLDRLEEQRKESEIELSPDSTVVEPGEPTVH
jgi:bifunctional DNase/RNase